MGGLFVGCFLISQLDFYSEVRVVSVLFAFHLLDDETQKRVDGEHLWQRLPRIYKCFTTQKLLCCWMARCSMAFLLVRRSRSPPCATSFRCAAFKPQQNGGERLEMVNCSSDQTNFPSGNHGFSQL